MGALPRAHRQGWRCARLLFWCVFPEVAAARLPDLPFLGEGIALAVSGKALEFLQAALLGLNQTPAYSTWVGPVIIA